MCLLELPDDMLMEIFEYLSYEDVSKKRQVCRRIDQICQKVLNRGFNKAVRLHAISFKRIKAMLPRRESERRNHCLARHADILTSIDTRISMLSMTYNKYMELSLCCFIPGRVLDEIFRILRLVSKTRKPLRPHEVLQELRDISSMAIEHFDEKIAGNLKTAIENSARCSSTAEARRMSAPPPPSNNFIMSLAGAGPWIPAMTASSSVSPQCTSSLSAVPSATGISPCCESIRQRVNTLLGLGRNGFLNAIKKPRLILESGHIVDFGEDDDANEQSADESGNVSMADFRKLELEYKKGIVKIHRMQQIQTHQSRRLQQALTTVTEMNMQINELKKRIEDLDSKNREIIANIKQINVGGEPTDTVAINPADDGAVSTSKKRHHDDSITHTAEGGGTTSKQTTITGTDDVSADVVSASKKPRTE